MDSVVILIFVYPVLFIVHCDWKYE